tara:strand:- start:276 stop:1331 length:1056 start_codon:yes stop_codon:yes gene_type:complete
MKDMPKIEEIKRIEQQATQNLSKISDIDKIDEWRIQYMGRNGQLTKILRGLGQLEVDDRRIVGATANQVKTSLENEMEKHQLKLENDKINQQIHDDQIDVTLPGRPTTQGNMHPITKTIREISEVFIAMGFSVEEGPEIELAKYNFDMLNIPDNHPAKDMWDTLWIDTPSSKNKHSMCLRTHTSPMQARIMESNDPPIRVLVPGKAFRYEATDATHEWHFHQIEGLAIDKGITFANLKGTLFEFAKRMFGDNRQVRFRCDFFPFVEPGVDMSIDCFKCEGDGCKICSETGWIEILGAGMVHPAVLANVGYDAAKYTGFAFGMGVERICMLKHGIEDIRLFYSNDLRFLKQF